MISPCSIRYALRQLLASVAVALVLVAYALLLATILGIAALGIGWLMSLMQ